MRGLSLFCSAGPERGCKTSATERQLEEHNRVVRLQHERVEHEHELTSFFTFPDRNYGIWSVCMGVYGDTARSGRHLRRFKIAIKHHPSVQSDFSFRRCKVIYLLCMLRQGLHRVSFSPETMTSYRRADVLPRTVYYVQCHSG